MKRHYYMKQVQRVLVVLALPFLVAAKPSVHFKIAAQDVVYGGYTTISVVPDASHEDSVLVACYIPDINGELVYADWRVVTDPDMVVGPIPPVDVAPLWPKPWLPGPGECIATHGYHRKNGMFRELATTTFAVVAP